MTLETLDPRTALLVIDLQKLTLGNPTVHPVADIVSRSAALAAAFRAADRTVVLAAVAGSPAGRNDYGGGGRDYPAELTELAPELEPHASDIVVKRSTWSAFAGTELRATLQQLGITQVVIVGVATSFGVESTARAAYDFGYNVVIVTDAITDLRAESHENSVGRVFPALSQTATTAELLAVLG